jgi:multidrug resistance efflux pump
VSLYRQPGRVAARTLALVAVAALVVGLAAGFAAGRASKSDPTLASQIDDLRARLAPAREGLELAPTEYPQGVRGGRVVSAPEFEAAQAAVRRAQKAIADNRTDLSALGAEREAALERAVAALVSAMEQRRDPAEVKRLAEAAGAALRAAVGP